jgi:hypothetical protein
MTETEWLKTQSGVRMYSVVIRRLSDRKRRLISAAIQPDRRKKDGIRPKVLARYIREQIGNPFQPYRCEPEWRTETVLILASAIESDHAFDHMPILADALEEAGCDEQPMLDHLRGPGPHSQGCWVLDLILDREPELFSQPPLTSTPRRMKLGPFAPPRPGEMA